MTMRDTTAMHQLIERAGRSVRSLAPAVTGLADVEACLEDAARAEKRGYFTPEEDQRLKARFGQYLIARKELLQTIDELRPIVNAEDRLIDDATQLRAFIAGYTAACLLIRAGRFVVQHGMHNRAIRRKLDEAAPNMGIDRKQFTRIYRSLTHPVNAWRMREAYQFAEAHRDEIESLGDTDALFRPVLDIMRESEEFVRVSMGEYLKARLRYRIYSWRRRNIMAFRRAMFALFEGSGRVIADMRNPFHRKRVTSEVLEAISTMLEPGDVIITRHDDAMSNLFLPGYWPHAAFHIGDELQRDALRIEVDEPRRGRWADPARVLEARKDGVLFRALADTLQVDCFTVLRPRLSRQEVSRAIARAVSHEGKLYDFEFDFRRSDRLVCTEVVYRAYDGIGPMNFALTRRAGRMTLSAEDLIDLAITGNAFTPVAVYGVPGATDRLVIDSSVSDVLANTYRESRRSEHASG